MVPLDSDRISPVPPYSGYSPTCSRYVYKTFTFYGVPFQSTSTSVNKLFASPTTPTRRIMLVWANPRSLATTCGITIVFYSSDYLDVSVHRVSFPCGIIQLHCIGLPHSDTFGYFAYLQLPEDFRSLSRPSSPLRAKASAVCSY